MTGEPAYKSRAVRSRRSRANNLRFEVQSQVAREIFAVAYLALSLLLLLSIYGKLGIVGVAIHNILKPIFGAGLHLIPIAFFGISAGLFFSRSLIFSLSRITGLILLFVSLLSIFHLSVPAEELFNAAQKGYYGGYIGFVTNFLFREAFQIGALGSAIVFVAALLISVLLTFEVSFIEFLKSAKPEIKLEKKRIEDEEEDGRSAEVDQEINIIKPNVSVDEEAEEEGNFEELMREEGGKEEIEAEAEPGLTDIKEGEAEPVTVHRTQQILEWEFPPLDILDPPVSAEAVNEEVLKENAEVIRDKLAQFGIEVQMSDVHVGPTVIQYTLKPHEGVKLSKITALKNDLALALAASSIRIEAPIPGKSLVGIEVPNEIRSIVRLKEILEALEWAEVNSKLKIPLGRNVSGKVMVTDLEGMPHLLIAGATGSGKSVGINSVLLALLYQNSPLDLKFIMIDPKRVELNMYNGIPHLLTPVITDVEKAATALRWATAEMNRRYQLLADTKHRNIIDYNSDANIADKLPRIIVLVDELADLMMATGKDVEASICRIAQMARAVGLHLIVATQRPSVDVLTGLIKANMPARIAYAVTSGVDSRTILDMIGAEDLLGRGDMLFISGQMSKPVRIQGVFVSSKEIERVTNRVKLTMEPEYNEEVTSVKAAGQQVQGLPPSSLASGLDPLYEQALRVIIESRKASASLLQRRLEIGYARAARILDEMEANRVIGPVRGAKPREILVSMGGRGEEYGGKGGDEEMV